ncbi:hypothetical protein [Pseudanabaena sp. UWO311]
MWVIFTDKDFVIYAVRPFPQLRMGLNQAFAAMAEQGDDILLDAVSPADWERVDWAWDYSH